MNAPPCPKCKHTLDVAALKAKKCPSCGKKLRIEPRKRAAAQPKDEPRVTQTVVSAVSPAVEWGSFGLLVLLVIAAVLIAKYAKDWNLGPLWYVFGLLGMVLMGILVWAEFMVSISTVEEDDDEDEDEGEP